jgi:hypothetical protein
LHNNRVADVSSISDCIGLRYLYLSNNQISDISPLSSLTKLQKLWLYSNQISNISPLSGLTKLQKLWLDRNQIRDISVVAGLTNLTHLDLSSNQISDISALSGIANMTELFLNNNRIRDISALSTLINLIQLDLRGNLLNQNACDIYIPLIVKNNPGINLRYDEFIPPIIYVNDATGHDNNTGLTPETAFATIQRGIDSAKDGDTILVYPGLYAEEINFKGKAITVQSAEDAAVLEAPGNFAVSFYMGEGPDSILKNFVICNSYMGIFVAHSSPTIKNVTVVNNQYGVEAYVAEPDIASSIFWNNAQGDLFQCEARYSCIERLGEGQGNLSVDPLFVDPDKGDYHLLSERGRYWPEHDVWVLDRVASPCIDAGDPTADSSTEPTPNGGRINMGAYGGTAYASMSERPCAGDINYDGIINMVDLAMLAENWLKSEPPSSNQPPWVIIVAPTDGAKFWITVTIELKVHACDTDGRVVKVEFYAGGNKIGADYDGSDGWGITWADYTQGSYTITAKATDDRGATTTSPEIEIEIRASPPPRR